MTKEGVDLGHPETTDLFPLMVYAGLYREPTLRTNETTARRGSKTNTEREPAKRANETTANAEQPKPKATQKTKPQRTPNPRPMQEALASIDWCPPPRAQVPFHENGQKGAGAHPVAILKKTRIQAIDTPSLF